MKRFVITSVVLLSTFSILIAQTNSDRLLNLKKLQLTVSKKDSVTEVLINDFISRTRTLKEYFDQNNNRIVLTGFDDLGHPKYIAVDNAGAAITTGVRQLQTNGSLGLNLQGEGIIVGVWDEGIVPPHQDFQERILSSEGANLAVHATHVTGTIIGSGDVNASARGMAPKAKAYTFDFNNDEAEMLQFTKPDQSTLLFSNHSYGLITGWRFANGGWTWFGNQNISNAEDYRFGFYDSDSKLWDEILYNSPYYTIVKSAGNDRSDTGSGTFPADCNGGAGYDCLGNIAVVKNLLTIGAVNKLSDYTGPASVVMSSFSSWGPTDDGRIKPDLVAAGVGVFSTSSNSNTAYTVLSGTSMATPNTTGSLILLQELKKKIDGDFMKAATVKALAIHTAKEAGPSDGPDYAFGWGLVDVEEGAKTLLDINGSKNIIREERLNNNSTFLYQIKAKANSKVTITIAWTDPAANPAPAALDPAQKMLVNDLDLFVTDSQGNTFLPWCLDPTNVTRSAFKANNALDNVEKIEFIAPNDGDYTVNVNHKGTLRNAAQDFSFVLTYSPLNPSEKNIFWIGGSGAFQLNQNWSDTPNGSIGTSTPNNQTNIFITDHSLQTNSTISLTENEVTKSINILSDKNITIDLAGNTLTVTDKIILGRNTTIKNGVLEISSSDNAVKKIVFENASLENVNLLLPAQNLSTWQISGGLKAQSITLSGGSLAFPSNTKASIRKLVANSTSTQSRLLLSGVELDNLEEFDLAEFKGVLVSNRSTLIKLSADSDNKYFDAAAYPLQGILNVTSGKTLIKSPANVGKLEVQGNLELRQNISTDTLYLGSGVSISIANQNNITASKIIQPTINEQQTTISADNEASIILQDRELYCLNNLLIENINLISESVVSINPDNSLINESTGWILQPCSTLAIAKFDVGQVCVGGYLTIVPQDNAAITEWEWNVNGNIYTDKILAIKIEDNTTKNIQLKIKTETDFTNSITKEVPVLQNTIADFSIIYSNGKLVSSRSSSSYNWILNNEIIEGKTTRDIVPNQEGSYQVLIRDNTCNKLSSEFIITSVLEQNSAELLPIAWPNPFEDKVYINGDVAAKVKSLVLLTIEGKSLQVQLEKENDIDRKMYINTVNLPKGMYLIKVVFTDNSYRVLRLVK